jgi:hypothetical protein
MWLYCYSLEIEAFQVKNIYLSDRVKILVLCLKVAFAHSFVSSSVYKGYNEPCE